MKGAAEVVSISWAARQRESREGCHELRNPLWQFLSLTSVSFFSLRRFNHLFQIIHKQTDQRVLCCDTNPCILSLMHHCNFLPSRPSLKHGPFQNLVLIKWDSGWTVDVSRLFVTHSFVCYYWKYHDSSKITISKCEQILSPIYSSNVSRERLIRWHQYWAGIFHKGAFQIKYILFLNLAFLWCCPFYICTVI